MVTIRSVMTQEKREREEIGVSGLKLDVAPSNCVF